MTLKQTLSSLYEDARLLGTIRYRNYYRYSDDKIEQCQGSHLYEKCFIIGTGPSLNETDLSPIKNKILFGVNRLYEGLDKFGIKPQYWCVGDRKVFDSCYQDILNLNTTLFLTSGAGQSFLKNYRTYSENLFLKPIVVRPLADMKTSSYFSDDVLKGVSGGMIILAVLQIALYMGFQEVYLIGCDCKNKGKHYDSVGDFDGVDDNWEHLMKLYEVCKKSYELKNRKIFNSTVGGNLEVFERIKLEDVK